MFCVRMPGSSISWEVDNLHNQSAFLSLLLITGLAALVPPLAAKLRRLRVPIVIGEILAGMLIGKSGLNLVESTPALEFLAEFGFVFLMFLSGLEVDLNALAWYSPSRESRPFRREPLCLALVSFILTLASAFAISFGLVKLGLVQNPFILELILSTTCLGIVVPVLKERSLIVTPYGQLMLLAALIADFVTLMLLSIAFGILRKGFTLDLMLFLVLMAFFAIALRVGFLASKAPKLKKLMEELSTATAQMQVRGAIALMVAWVALAYALGIEVILGAFLAGVIVSIITGPEESALREKLDALGFGFFIPIFFITVGSRFDLRVLISSGKALVLLFLLLLTAYGVKVIPSLLFKLAFSWRESIAAGFLLSSRLSLIIAASALALELGVISEAVNAAILLVAVVTCTLSPVLFNRLGPPLPEARRRGVIIVGMDQFTGLLVERLAKDGEKVTVLGCKGEEKWIPYCQKAEIVMAGDTDEKTLARAGASQVAAIVVALDDPRSLLEVCRVAKERFGIPVIVARTDDSTVMEQLKALGVRVIQPALATAIALEGALRFPSAFDMLADHGDNVEIGEAILRNPRLDGLPLRRVQLPGNALVLGIRRKGEVIIPHGDTVLRRGDLVMLVGNPESLKGAKAMLEGPGF
ncbi:MAG: hypothetical protein DRI61_14610 [Chloroflexi bacterium]|nr:MAG: hypothetical protein DRI61_14610 [Chloroflexota bacterium]